MSIIRKSIQETTGNSNNIAQSFKQNIFSDAFEAMTLPFAFDVPMYTTAGGTKDYYGQNPNAIFTSLVKPFVRFDFSANTTSFGPNVYIKHDIYRVSWDMFSAAQKKFKNDSNESITTERFITETIDEFDETTGKVNRKTITKKNSEIESLVRSFKDKNNFDKSGIESEKQITGLNQGSAPVSRAELLTILQEQLSEPLYSITAETSGITTNIYDLQIEQYIKNIGEYKTELFKDRDQFIIDTNFIFDIELTPGLTGLQVIGENGYLIDQVYKSTVRGETSSENMVIENGEFKGLIFKGGAYFSYFEVPDKPIFEYPTPTGQISTFTPEIFWSNGEGADSYLVQVSYNTGDTGFTGTVFTYVVPKTDEQKEVAMSKTKDSASEFSTDKSIRKYQMSLKTNKCLIYRVGNVKELENMFGVRQNVVTFSETLSLCTQVEPTKTYVYTESDSPYAADITGLRTPPSLDSESPLSEYSLSGVVSGSTVSGATLQLIYPNLSFANTTTNAVGEFSFGSLEEGVYTLNTMYRGYALDSRPVIINSDTSLFIQLEIRWDNTYDIWAIKENDVIKY
jgi:hypothetical protein